MSRLPRTLRERYSELEPEHVDPREDSFTFTIRCQTWLGNPRSKELDSWLIFQQATIDDIGG